MILYYALGGGLGHITRARKVLAALGLSERATLLTASRFASDPRVTGGLPVVRVPPRLGHDKPGFGRWLEEVLKALRPEELIVDSFPGGILGELCALPLPPARHIARRLRWAAYAERLEGLPLPRFDAVYGLEPLAQDHEAALGKVTPLTLAPAPPGPPLTHKPHWVVAHSGPDHELRALIVRAANAPRIVVVSPRRPAKLPRNAAWRDLYPVAPHLAHAERIITAAGFNLMHETAQLRARHTAVPFARALDDQFARCQLAVEA